MYRFDKLQYDHDRASLCECLLDGLMTSTAKMARVNRDDMLSAQPRPHGCVRAASLDRLYTELKGCAQTLKKVQTVLYRLQHDRSVTRRHYVNPHGPPSPDAPRRLDSIPWFTQDQLDAMRRERTVLPSYKRRRTDDESDPTVPWSPQYVEHLTNVKTKFVYEHLKYCTCPHRPRGNESWDHVARAEHHLNCYFSRLYRHFDDHLHEEIPDRAIRLRVEAQMYKEQLPVNRFDKHKQRLQLPLPLLG
mmetsp:Transcript_27139/g.87667  ORF Transcript_27139/g.87667 Transcript_27139/m.87667 type:complete len:247 (-) Transcript_27139:845-1585(-)